MRMSAYDVPLPGDAAGVQVDDEESLGDGHLTFTTRQSASEFKAFLREADSRLGWSDQTRKNVDDTLVFTTPAKWRHVANLSRAKGGATKVDFIAFTEPTKVIAKTDDARPSASVDVQIARKRSKTRLTRARRPSRMLLAKRPRQSIPRRRRSVAERRRKRIKAKSGAEHLNRPAGSDAVAEPTRATEPKRDGQGCERSAGSLGKRKPRRRKEPVSPVARDLRRGEARRRRCSLS